jgi:hypothetical protein
MTGKKLEDLVKKAFIEGFLTSNSKYNGRTRGNGKIWFATCWSEVFWKDIVKGYHERAEDITELLGEENDREREV